MKSRLIFPLFIGLVLFNAAETLPAPEGIRDAQFPDDPVLGTRRVAINGHKDFGCLTLLLGHIADHAGKTGTQYFYVSPVGHEGKRAFVRVYWPSDKSILIVTFPIPCVDGKPQVSELELFWYEGNGRIDLETDVVPTQDDVGSSTYLVSQPWVDKVIQDCRKNGYPVTVKIVDSPE